jgi:hypothetical protein
MHSMEAIKTIPAQAAKYHTTIHKLTLSKFIDCICDRNYQSLVIEGEPSEDVLLEAWINIVDQYNDILGQSDMDYRLYLSQYRELAQMRSKQQKILLLTEVLDKIGYVELFAKRLNNLLITQPLKFDITNQEIYAKDIARCYNRVRGLNIHIHLIESQIKFIESRLNQGGVAVPKREDFENALINISDHAGRELDPDVITVYNYCMRVVRLNEYAKRQQLKKR